MEHNIIKEEWHADKSEPIRRQFMETKTSDACIVADPAICHDEPTFRGTRILVADVLEQVESGMAYEAIIEEWRYEIDRDAIAESLFTCET